MHSPSANTTPSSVFRWIGWGVLFLIFVASTGNFPHPSGTDLDPSWRMAYGYFFKHQLQFGREVVFNYGPLGFVMGRTYSGLQFAAIVVGQLGVAAIAATAMLRLGSRLQGAGRWLFFAAMLLFGVTYEDALHIAAIALMGFLLLRSDNGPAWTVGLTICLAVIGLVKFTNLTLVILVIAVVIGLALWRGRRREAWLVGGVFAGAFLTAWVACWQNPLHLVAYLRTSLEISQGYNDVMAVPTPWPQLWRAFVVLGALGAYLALHLYLNPDKPRAVANAVLMAGYLFIDWKHGFVRSDGHMIGFFFSALLPLTAYPSLLEDPPRFRRLHLAVFLAVSLIGLSGVDATFPRSTTTCLARFESKLWANLDQSFFPEPYQRTYRDKLLQARTQVDLPKTRGVVGRASLDVLGHEQSAALFNEFNYRPRPVFQSYSVFNPSLSRLNRQYFEGDSAPEFVLAKIQTIDSRLPMIDDSEVWRLLPHRYSFVHAENGFRLWRKKPGAFDPATIAPKRLATTELAVGDKLALDAYSGKQLWVRIDLQPTLLGRLVGLVYKLGQAKVVLTDVNGTSKEFLLPLPMGRTGFILSPIIEDLHTFTAFSRGQSARETRSLALKIDPRDRHMFARTARIEIFELKPVDQATISSEIQLQEVFHFFPTRPNRYDVFLPASEATLDNREVVVMHAPSSMVFALPQTARQASGHFGFLSGAYSDGGGTDGAEFSVSWVGSDGPVVLFRRHLNPAAVAGDRGIQGFTVDLSKVKGGQLLLEIDPGPNHNNSWDWTVWSAIEIK